MTDEEAIYILQGIHRINRKMDEAVDMAIKALEHPEKNVIAVVPCGDAISRQAVDDAIYDYSRSCDVNYQQIMEFIDKIPTVTPQTRWIPVSEKLPDEKDYCLCCDKDGYITIGFVSKWSKQWCFDDPEVDIDVIAWMPLPEPYKAESEDEK